MTIQEFIGLAFPELAKGAGAGLVAWFLLRIEILWMRRDLEALRFIVHSEKNERNLITRALELSHRVKALEIGQGITHHE